MNIPSFASPEDAKFFSELFTNRIQNYSTAINHVKNEFYGKNYGWEHLDGTQFRVIKDITDGAIVTSSQVFEKMIEERKRSELIEKNKSEQTEE